MCSSTMFLLNCWLASCYRSKICWSKALRQLPQRNPRLLHPSPRFSAAWVSSKFANSDFWRAESLRAIEADHSTCFLVRAQELHQGSEPMHIIGRTTMFSANQVRVDIVRYRERTIKDYGRSKGHNTIRLMNSSLSDCSMLGLVHGFTSRRSFIASQSITKYYMWLKIQLAYPGQVFCVWACPRCNTPILRIKQPMQSSSNLRS